MHVSRSVEFALIGFSVAMFVASVVLVPILVARLPPDHFLRSPSERSATSSLLRSFVGAFVVLLGIAMLALPGQGVLTIVAGLVIMDLPLNRRLLLRLLASPKVRDAVDALRRKMGKAPLILPDVTAERGASSRLSSASGRR